MKDKNPDAYMTIGEVAKSIGLIDIRDGSLKTHTIRFWEKEFKQIKPRVRAGNRRYYSNKDFRIIKVIKYLLKDQGLTIKGVKKLINNSNFEDIDVNSVFSVNSLSVDPIKIKNKLINISTKLKELKKITNG